MKNSVNGSELFADSESFLSDLSMQEEALLSGGCSAKGKKKTGNKKGKCSKSDSSKSSSGCIKVTVPPVVVGGGY